MSFSNQINIPVDDIPERWYNIMPELPEPLPPPKDPDSGPSRVENLPNFLLSECLKQEMSQDGWIDIPGGIRSLYAQAGRPRPLFRALNLEKKIGTKARLYYKAEFYSPTGSHKVNTALAQAYYAREQGFERLTTETGAGQWGTALAYVAALVGLECTIYWVRAVHDWKVSRRNFMKLYGAEVFASPSDRTKTGRSLYEKDKEHPGSLGIAISEGVEDAMSDDRAVYCLGSVLNHVLIHQTVIGLELEKQFEKVGDEPDIMISCLGGGSNFGGFVLPRMGMRLRGDCDTRFVAAQSEVAPNLTGEYKYDFADHGEITPLLKMYTLGHTASMDPIKGDGLRYHGCAPILSLLRHHGYIDQVAYPKDEKKVMEGAKLFVESEGFLPAPESAYSIRCAIDEALKPENSGKVIAFNVSGHGFMDMEAYKIVLEP